MSATYLHTDIDMKIVVKRWCDLNMTIHASFSGLFVQKTALVTRKKKQARLRTSHRRAAMASPERHASCVSSLTC